MSHKILGWFLGILYVKALGKDVERFVNLCRNRGIELWQLSIDAEREHLYFYITLKDFYRLRKIARKSKVFLVVQERQGFPFCIQSAKEHLSFWVGIFCFASLLFFFSGRIWSIDVSGQSYHTKESILKYLNKKGIYGGMAKSEVSCVKIRELLRKKYADIGWISVEEMGSCIHIRIKEVQMVERKKKKKKGNLVADADGTVVSIVTRKGTAKVKAGNQVKKGDVLISGVVEIVGDGDVIVKTEYVPAAGDVILCEEESYEDVLEKNYQKKVFTGRERKIYEWDLLGKKFFLYNPLNNLESYEKYDIIREGGVLCPALSLRFPVKQYVKVFREVQKEDAVYQKEEAKEILMGRFHDYIQKRKEEGFVLKRAEMSWLELKETFSYTGKLIFDKKQETYRNFHQKNDVKDEVDGNGEGNTDGNMAGDGSSRST